MSKEKEKKKSKTLLLDYPAIYSALTTTIQGYKSLVQSSVIQELDNTMRDTLMTAKQNMAVLQSAAPYLREIERKIEKGLELYSGVLTTEVITSFMQVARESERLSQQYAEINRMVEETISPPSIIPEIEALSSNADKTNEALLNHIAMLKKALTSKEKELAKEKEEKKELLRIIDEMRKRLKKKYVA